MRHEVMRSGLYENLSKHLNERLLGQAEAIGEFAKTVALAIEGRPRPDRTKGMILLAGPTGTGKTDMVLLATRYLFGDRAGDYFARFDMAEYQHADSVVRFLGGPGQPALLGEAIDRLNKAAGEDGVAFLLLDEIEKAFEDLVTILLSFDAARVTTADGVTHDLSRIIVVVTSNVGSRTAGELQFAAYTALKEQVLKEAEKRFRKETVARFDAAIIMNRLEYSVQREITQRLLARELELQSSHYMRPIIADKGVVDYLINVGFTASLGARNIRRTVEREIGTVLLPWLDFDEDQDAPDRWTRTLLVREDRTSRRLRVFRGGDLRSAEFRNLQPTVKEEAVLRTA